MTIVLFLSTIGSDFQNFGGNIYEWNRSSGVVPIGGSLLSLSIGLGFLSQSSVSGLSTAKPPLMDSSPTIKELSDLEEMQSICIKNDVCSYVFSARISLS